MDEQSLGAARVPLSRACSWLEPVGVSLRPLRSCLTQAPQLVPSELRAHGYVGDVISGVARERIKTGDVAHDIVGFEGLKLRDQSLASLVGPGGVRSQAAVRRQRAGARPTDRMAEPISLAPERTGRGPDRTRRSEASSSRRRVTGLPALGDDLGKERQRRAI